MVLDVLVPGVPRPHPLHRHLWHHQHEHPRHLLHSRTSGTTGLGDLIRNLCVPLRVSVSALNVDKPPGLLRAHRRRGAEVFRMIPDLCVRLRASVPLW